MFSEIHIRLRYQNDTYVEGISNRKSRLTTRDIKFEKPYTTDQVLKRVERITGSKRDTFTNIPHHVSTPDNDMIGAPWDIRFTPEEEERRNRSAIKRKIKKLEKKLAALHKIAGS